MDALTEKLAAALRDCERIIYRLSGEDLPGFASGTVVNAREALADYDAAQLPEAEATIDTPRQWQVNEPGWNVIIPRTHPNYCDEVVFDIPFGLDEADNAVHLRNAKRIVACVNACAGIPTSALESAGTITVTGERNGERFAHDSSPRGPSPEVQQALARIAIRLGAIMECSKFNTYTANPPAIHQFAYEAREALRIVEAAGETP